MSIPTVSVVFTNFNAGRTIEKCIQRALNQTLKPIELLIVDAGSTDGCQEIALKYKSQGVRLIVVKGIKPGPGEMMAAAEAKGEFIATLNPDVYTSNDWLEKSYNRWLQGYAVVGGLRVNGGDKYNFSWCVLPPKHLVTRIEPELGLTTMSMFFKKSLLDELNMTNVLDSRDAELQLRIQAKHLPFCIDPDIKVIHDHRMGGIRKSFNRSAWYVMRNMDMVRAVNGKIEIGESSGIHISISRYIREFLLIDAFRVYLNYRPLMKEMGIKVNLLSFVFLKAVFNAGEAYGLIRYIWGAALRSNHNGGTN